MVIIPKIVVFISTSWETTVLFKCDLKEEEGYLKVWKDKYSDEVVSETINFNRLRI